jgi:hypothetical protein
MKRIVALMLGVLSLLLVIACGKESEENASNFENTQQMVDEGTEYYEEGSDEITVESSEVEYGSTEKYASEEYEGFFRLETIVEALGQGIELYNPPVLFEGGGDSWYLTPKVPEGFELSNKASFVIDDKMYELPLSCDELIAEGWELYQVDEDYYDPEVTTEQKFAGAYTGNTELSVGYVSDTDYEMNYNGSKIYKIMVGLSNWDYYGGIVYPAVILPGGIDLSSTKEEIIEVYGEPNEEFKEGMDMNLYMWEGGTSDTEYDWFWYQIGDNCTLQFITYKYEGVVDQVAFIISMDDPFKK